MIERFMRWFRRKRTQPTPRTTPIPAGTQAYRHWWLRYAGSRSTPPLLAEIGRTELRLGELLSDLDRDVRGARLRAGRNRLQTQVTTWIEPGGELERALSRIDTVKVDYGAPHDRCLRLVSEAERLLETAVILDELMPRHARLVERFPARLPGLWRTAAGDSLAEAFDRVVSPAGAKILSDRIDSLEQMLVRREREIESFLQTHQDGSDATNLERAAEKLRAAIVAEARKSVKLSVKRIKTAAKEQRALR